jgi:hypothetical protein
MANWRARVKVKHLFTEDEDHDSLQKSMNAIADVLDKEPLFKGFDTSKWRKIPDVGYTIEIANKLVSDMYDWADDHRIWME